MATAKKGLPEKVAARLLATPNGETSSSKVKLLSLDLRVIQVPIRGTTELICERISPETITQISEKHQGKAQLPKEFKDPDKCFRESCYLLPQFEEFYKIPSEQWFKDGKKTPQFGFPAIAFKIAMVDGANDMGMAMTEVRRMLHVLSDPGCGCLARISFQEVRMREDTPKNANGVIDVRYRAAFVGWSTVLNIRFNGSVISPEQIVNLVNIGGFGVGVGGWRIKGKKSTGWAGGFEVVKD